RVAVYGRFLSDLRAKRKKLIDSIQVLSTANYHQREFVASVSHELRAPVHAMSMALEDVDTAGIDPIKNEAGLGEVQVSIWQLLRSVDNLLDYAALFAGRLGLNVVQVALPGFFDNLVAVLVSPDFVREESRITRRVTLSVDPDLPSWVRLDPRRLTQVLTELCRNAYASSRNSTIAIDVGSVVDAGAGVVHVSIAVTDSGGGISEKDQQNIFDPFLPLSGSVSRDTGGVGLGLPIAYSLVRLMNGNVLLQSEMGVGSTFTVTLQLLIVDAPKPPSAAATLPVQRTQHGQVLVVDDSEQTLLIVGRLINKNFPNVTVLVASDAEDAIRMFALQPIQVVLMDMLMPTVDGLTATRRMRSEVESSRAEKACIIGFTADGSDEARMACLSAGMDDLILKPFHHQALLDRIGKALSDRQ
ncbi:ATP-binding protein, partial [Burkholderiaceae bacterium]|nr:ATP-binding protein [Burkholderiaceae bacterium]